MTDLATRIACAGRRRVAAADQLVGTRAVHVMPLAVAMMALGGALNPGRGDVEFGRHLASECLTCHRAETAIGTVPDLFGMAEPRLSASIKAYRDKRLPNPVMQGVASRLTDAEIAALAAYFAQAQAR